MLIVPPLLQKVATIAKENDPVQEMMRQENMFGLDISQFAAVFNNEKVTLIIC